MLKLCSLPETQQEKDVRLWSAWTTAPVGYLRDQATNALAKALEGPIMSAVNTYRAAPVPGITLELEGKRLGMEAAKEWDKNKGSSLASYVGTMVRQRLYRWVTSHQNVARIPEEQVRQIGRFQMASNHLTDRLGRDPTSDEMADHLGLPVSRVTKMRKALRKDLIMSGVADDVEEGIEDIAHDPDYERAMMAYYGLTDMEKLVFDFSLGAHGQPKLKAGEIATRLKVSPARVSALKEALGHKLQPYLGNV